MASGKGKLRFFVKQIMQMNVLASTVLFLLIGPFDFVSSWDVESTDSASVLQVLSPAHVFISVNDVLELNCSIRGPSHGLLPTQLLWRHNDTWVHNSSSVVDNSTVQLKFHTHYKDSGVYRCEVFYNSSSFKKATSKNITVIVGEKPKLGRCPLSIVNVLGKPVQALTLQWTALQINVTNSLIVGKIQNFNCVTQDRTFCSQTPRIRNELLSCYLGKDVLREVFQWSELHGTCADGNNGTKCDVFCAKLKVESKFGASESNTCCHWILHSKARCPPPRNMSVTLGERSITVSWLRPQLVWTNYSVYYRLAYNGTQLLVGKSLPKYRPLRRHFEELSYTITDIEPFTRYTITLACTLSGYFNAESGPAIFTEVISREEVPSKAPICEVVNRSIDGDAFVLLKPLPKYRWNGIPKKYVVYYNSGDQQRRVNVSLDGLNATEPLPVRITNIDVRKKYSVTATMCTVAGCGQNSDPPCFIPMIHTKEPSDEIETVPQTPADSTTGATLEAIIAASAVFAGLFLAILVICWIKRRRSRKKQRPSLETLFTGLNVSRLYENDADDGPSLCDESQAYDTIPRALLLKNINCPVSEI